MTTYKRQRYLFMTTDPVHVGTGGYRLGRVDNSIVREPGTNIPKIPGTSLHGAARSYAARLFENPAAAGQDQEGVSNPSQDPVCYTFGYLKRGTSPEAGTVAYSGVVNIFDAHMLLFPVHSMVGPVWVSTLGRLQAAGFDVANIPDSWDAGAVLLTTERKDALNLGWLMMEVRGKISIVAPEKWRNDSNWATIQDSVVLVQETLLSQVVNSNLEVRTSVAIDPERGAAEDKALFTYEALPRSTFLTGEVVLDDYRSGEDGRPFPQNETATGTPLPDGPWSGPLDVVASGLRMIEWLGVGGMGTRGFGRMVCIGDPLVQEHGKEVWQ